MTIKVVVKMGNQQLATPSLFVEDILSVNIRAIVKDMRDTMLDEGGVGIAAPQIGCNLRIIMFGFDDNARYPDEDPIPFTVLINPVIKFLSDEMVDGWEGVFKCARLARLGSAL